MSTWGRSGHSGAMTREKEAGAGRMTGAALRTAAALLENPVVRPLLVPTAYKRLMLPLLRERVLPDDLGLYTHSHLHKPHCVP